MLPCNLIGKHQKSPKIHTYYIFNSKILVGMPHFISYYKCPLPYNFYSPTRKSKNCHILSCKLQNLNAAASYLQYIHTMLFRNSMYFVRPDRGLYFPDMCSL